MNLNQIKSLTLRALQALSGHCDGASTQDKIGFNGTDSRWGKQMAVSDPSKWSPRCTFMLINMIGKYSKQLSRYGVDIEPLSKFKSQPDVEAVFATVPASAPVTSYGAPAAPLPVQRKVIHALRHTYEIRFPYNPALVETVKSLPYKNREWVAAEKHWMVAFKDEAESLRLMVEFMGKLTAAGFEFEPAVLAEIVEARTKNEETERLRAGNFEASRATEAEISIPGFCMDLRPYQRGGVRYATDNKRVWIADDMGLGKTPQSLATVELNGAYPCLIVCRANLILNWQREIKKALPHRMVSTSPFSTAGDFLIVSHYDLIKAKDDLKNPARRQWQALIGDESQDFKGRKAKRTAALIEIAKAQKIPYRMLLTGTPLENRPSELISQLEILGRLDDFGGFIKFAYRYCGATRGSFGLEMGAATNSKELNEQLRSICMIRRLKGDVLKELPAKDRQILNVSISNRKDYDAVHLQVQRDIIKLKADADQRTGEVMKSVGAMDMDELIEFVENVWPRITKKQVTEWRKEDDRQAILNFIHQGFRNKAASVESAMTIMLLNRLKESAALGKMEAFKEWATDMIEGGKRVVVFGFSREVQRQAAAAIPGAIWSRSGQFKNTQAAIDYFAAHPECPAIILSLKGDNAGLNGLQSVTSYVAFIDQGWVFKAHEQAEDRLHRIGQTDSVTCFYFLAQNTVDAKVWELLMSKEEISRAVIDGETDAVQSGGSVVKQLAATLAGRRDSDYESESETREAARVQAAMF